MIIIRKAAATDIDAVSAIYEAIHTEEESGRAVIGWVRGVYPTRGTAVSALSAGELYVMEDNGIITATARINQKQEPAYASVPWKTAADDHEVLVLHTLIVDPRFSGMGYGPRFIEYYEELAARMHCKALRIDTNMRNTRARRLYARLGYTESGIIPTVFNGISGVQLVCLEKSVTLKEKACEQ